MTTSNGQNGKAPVDEATQQRIEEVIKQAGQPQTPGEPAKTGKRSQKKGEIEKSAAAALENQTASQAEALVRADRKSKQARVQMGLRSGLEDAKDIRKGYQLGLLAGLTQGKVEDTLQLSSQLELLRQHTEQEAASDIQISLEDLEGAEELDPLEALYSELSDALIY